MTINITTKNFELSQTTKENVIIPAIDKLNTLTDSVDVIVAKEGRRIIVKIKTEAYNTKINATGEEIRLITALSNAIDIAKRKIRKAKTHESNKTKNSSVKNTEEKETYTPAIIETKHIVAQTMDENEAIYNAEMTDSSFYFYRDETGNLAIIIKNGNDYTKFNIE